MVLRPPVAQAGEDGTPYRPGSRVTLSSSEAEPRRWQDTGMLLSMAGDEGRAGRSSKSGKGGASSKTKASGKGAKTSRGASASAVKSDPMPTEEESFAVLGLDDVPPGSYKDDLHPNLRIPPKKKSRAYRREGRISKDRVRWRTFDELTLATDEAIRETANRRNQKHYRKGNLHAADKPVSFPKRSLAPVPFRNPQNKKLPESPMTAWRTDKLADLTYTQFWTLVRERAVEKATYSDDRRSLYVTLNEHAPGGARTEKVVLPFDPDLFEHMLEHGVYIDYEKPNPFYPILHSIARLFFPITFALWLVQFTFRMGRKKKRDDIFGGIKMQSIQPGKAQYDFTDIAGIDSAPCILFIDEFDGVGKARSATAGNEEAVHTINQLLSELDGFDDNTGVVVFAASNRPQSLDSALTRPGRFDRIITLPYPNLEGRIQVLKVHARGKRVAQNLDYHKISRATAGFSGAQIMNLMNNAAIVAARQGRLEISDAEVFEALERITLEELGDSGVEYDLTEIPQSVRSSIAVYEAARALVGYITPDFDEVQRVSVCPNGTATGSTYFLPLEEQLETRIIERGYLESKMVVALAGRCAEMLVLGEANYTSSAGEDLTLANYIAREMVYHSGFGARMGPVALQDDDENFLMREKSEPVSNISTELSLVAYQDVKDILAAAEAKAYYGIVKNYAAFEALVQNLTVRETLTGTEISDILDKFPLERYPRSTLSGFYWEEDGSVGYPGKPKTHEGRLVKVGVTRNGVEIGADTGNGAAPANGAEGTNGSGKGKGKERYVPEWWAPGNPYAVRSNMGRLLLREGM
ncbi:ATP-dependent zinc metalloprotease FTSH 1, chloroplastic [Auxenochlorella protothecoides]|uniref:ATP-dependent zinc metalloprotease FTSH 1, chloroplastic n=1 Tax=Auxenochlorella protothecoides TaxID=3075 RepID=A0A087SMT1_AUXPR|nr:ATP-dependent zinc metalloprotease FTSH 1, chloroplastic [Auxenochlorella protothecoides]KFM27035.1 ATP-dependent zinc metalloprotease FTSH 1, chloroplastic [Auxenochlorella protothecoides]